MRGLTTGEGLRGEGAGQLQGPGVSAGRRPQDCLGYHVSGLRGASLRCGHGQLCLLAPDNRSDHIMLVIVLNFQ